MAGGAICDKKPVRLGSGEKAAEGLYGRHGKNMWLGRVWTCLWRASMFSTFSLDDLMPVSLSIQCFGSRDRCAATTICAQYITDTRVHCLSYIDFFVCACSEAYFMLSGTVCGGTSVLARSGSAFFILNWSRLSAL